ncbi:MAG: hypothetical protein L0216_02230 [Planctomycetales bacterium]|nr:hypothetical protein [Planctomycetales bacterium]
MGKNLRSLADAQKALKKLEGATSEIRSFLGGLEEILGGNVSSASANVSQAPSTSSRPWSARILANLQSANAPRRPKEIIRELLGANGPASRRKERVSIYNAIGYLVRKGLVRKVDGRYEPQPGKEGGTGRG